MKLPTNPLHPLVPAMLCAAISPPAAGELPGYWAKVNGHPLYYLRLGEGPPVLLLHGGGDSGEGSFRHQIDDLVAAGHEVIAPDQVGQGRSPYLPGPLSYGAMVEDTADLLRQMAIESTDVVGFSDGGILGLMLAARYPDLVHRLAVSGVNIASDGLDQSHLAALQAQSDAAAGSTEAPGLDAKLRELWLNAPTEQDLTLDTLAGIRQPVLVLSGDRDVIRIEHTLAIYQGLSHAQLFVLPDTGHRTFDTRPELVNPVLVGFLAGS